MKSIPITADWTLLTHARYWVLQHTENNCNGYIAAPLNEETKRQRCSGCDRKADNSVLSKIPFLTQYKKVVNAWNSNV